MLNNKVWSKKEKFVRLNIWHTFSFSKFFPHFLSLLKLREYSVGENGCATVQASTTPIIHLWVSSWSLLCHKTFSHLSPKALPRQVCVWCKQWHYWMANNHSDSCETWKSVISHRKADSCLLFSASRKSANYSHLHTHMHTLMLHLLLELEEWSIKLKFKRIN